MSGGLWGFLSALAWALVAAGAVWRAEPLAAAWIEAWRVGRVPPAPVAPVPIPDDLVALALAESDEWAREDTVKRARELYDEYGGDWDKVRAAFGVGGLS